jgi:hypothetical protein
MLEIVKLFYQLSLFKKAPQDIPYSLILTRLMLLIYTAISFLLFFMSAPWFKAILQVVTDLSVMLIFTRILLFWVGKTERYQQTLSALLGTDALISFCALPATASLITPTTANGLTLFAFLMVVGLMLWHWAVVGHIFRHALSQSLSFGLGIALLYMMTAYQVMGFLFPEVSVNH